MIGFFTSKIRVTFKCKSTAQGKMYWPIKDEGLVVLCVLLKLVASYGCFMY